jgi:micrococcal nuclease
MIKKLVSVFIVIIVLIGCATPSEKEKIVLAQCIDGDTARFENIGRVRFLYIDTPELYPTPQAYAQEAADFTCDLLTNASNIYIEYDGRRVDDYERVLGWIWVDDKLLQEEIVKAGYVGRFYNYENVRYKARIDQAFQKAKQNKVGMFK